MFDLKYNKKVNKEYFKIITFYKLRTINAPFT
jgi:hypothetical protein